MAIDRIASIESVLQQMRALTQASPSAFPMNEASRAEQGGFAAELQRSLRQVSQAQNLSSDQAKAFVAGEPGLALNDVMIDMQKASIGFQTTVQARNRLVAAYQEIASMPV